MSAILIRQCEKRKKNALVYTLMQSNSLHLCYFWCVPFNPVRKCENEKNFHMNRDHIITPALVIMTVYTEFSVSHQGGIFVRFEKQQNKYCRWWHTIFFSKSTTHHIERKMSTFVLIKAIFESFFC